MDGHARGRGKGKERDREEYQPKNCSFSRNFGSNSSHNWSNSGKKYVVSSQASDKRSNSGQNYSNSGQIPSTQVGNQPIKGRVVHVPVNRCTANPVPETPVSENSEVKLRIPVNRPDSGGLSASRWSHVYANHLPVNFDPQLTILHYDVNIEPELKLKPNAIAKISKADAQLIKNKLFSNNPRGFPATAIAYDGEKNIYSAVALPAGKYKVTVSKGEDSKPSNYTFTIKLVNKLDLNKLASYFAKNSAGKPMPREILQAMDLVMREHPSHCRIPIGRRFYSKRFDRDCDLGWGIVASRGFHQSLDLTAQGLALKLNTSVIAFRKPIPVLDYLRDNTGISLRENPFMDQTQRRHAETALKGLKVKVTNRKTLQTYVIRGLTKSGSNDLHFELEIVNQGGTSKRIISIVDYFWEKYEKEIEFKSVPCLNLSRGDRLNYVPMEFCELVEGQRYPNDLLPRDSAQWLKTIASTKPWKRYSLICDIVAAPDGPCRGRTTKRFHISVSEEMTKVKSRILAPPELKVRAAAGNQFSRLTPRSGDCQWNLLRNHVLDGKRVDRWAIFCFKWSNANEKQQLVNVNRFAESLSRRCNGLGIHMTEKPLFTNVFDMNTLQTPAALFNALDHAHRCSERRLQILICVMADRHPGYKNLKRIAETEIGFVTQCCLINHVKKCSDQFLANLALKINAKVGGSNVALYDRLPRLSPDDGSHVIFMGADVNHPSAQSTSNHSIAAVVGTVNWPDANRYVARFRLQERRAEKIENLGGMCREVLETYGRANGKLPEKIIFFRDGVSDGQFDMVLNEELTSIKEAMGGNYSPTITLVVAQKRHQTRLFPADERQGSKTGNVFPGTVVDTTIIHAWGFDFYLCSHDGSLGTSKPTHYHVLWDEHNFSSDEMQRLIYNLCYTFARCTKPVSLVPPVYYADLVAYRVRLYLEGLSESRSPASTVSSSSSSLSSSSSTSSINDILKLHCNVENAMYFS